MVQKPIDGQARGALGRVLSGLQAIETAVAVVMLLAVAGALIADLAGRELFGNGIFGAQRFAVHATFIAGMLGFVIATGRNAHLRIKAADRILPARLDALIDHLGSLVSVVICLGLAWYSWNFVGQTMRLNERSTTLGIAIWPIQAFLPYAFVSAGLRHLMFAAVPALKPQPKEGDAE